MNILIKELADQAKKSVPHGLTPDKWIEVYNEKFAELIVRECLDISHRESHLPNAVFVDERSDKFIKDIHNRVDRATRKHFGVE